MISSTAKVVSSGRTKCYKRTYVTALSAQLSLTAQCVSKKGKLCPNGRRRNFVRTFCLWCQMATPKFGCKCRIFRTVSFLRISPSNDLPLRNPHMEKRRQISARKFRSQLRQLVTRNVTMSQAGSVSHSFDLRICSSKQCKEWCF